MLSVSAINAKQKPRPIIAKHDAIKLKPQVAKNDTLSIASPKKRIEPNVCNKCGRG